MSRGFQSLLKICFALLSPKQKAVLGKVAYRAAQVPDATGARGTAGRRPVAKVGEFNAVSQGYDAHESAHKNRAFIQSVLDAAEVEYVTLPSESVLEPTVVVPAEFSKTLDALLTGLTVGEGWVVRRFKGPYRRELRRKRMLRSRAAELYLIGRVNSTHNGFVLSSSRESVAIQVWDRSLDGSPRSDGSKYTPGTLYALTGHPKKEVTHISPGAWAAAQELDGHELELGGPLLMQVTEPIDLVYTWVDGTNPQWLERKNSALVSYDLDEVHRTAASHSRFYNHDELKYSLRSVEMYASWIRHIYIVTDGQTPPWLDASHPKITVVHHQQIFRDVSVLPVFNSHAIESQLHHIPGLSERYLYLNDDVFIARPVAPSLFFTSSGLSKFFPSLGAIGIEAATSRDMPVMSAAKNNREFVLNMSGRVVTNKFKHTPHPQIRSVLETLELEHPALFEQLAASPIRHPNDYSIASALHHNVAYLMGKAIEGQVDYDYVDVGSYDAELRLLRLGKRNDIDVFCLNETVSSEQNRGQIHRLVSEFLDARFPVPSSFELS